MTRLRRTTRPDAFAEQVARLRRRGRRHLERWSRRLRRVDERVVTLQPAAGSPRRGLALFSFIVDPILEAKRRGAAAEDLSHTHFWESLRMAELLCEEGWEVDAISWTARSFEPRRGYDLMIDVRTHLERWRPQMPGALAVAHLDTAHWSFNNPAEQQRLAALAERRGAILAPRRQLPQNRLIETADRATYLGNDFTAETYGHAGIPMQRVRVSVPRTYPWLDREWESARRRFLWFGSGGLVHKGLDLVLEAFAAMPELELYVCGPIERERDFERLYRRELYELANVHTLGWIDVDGPAFLELVRRCGALVYPSCAEGGGSSALTCMHAGLVPLLTRSASVDLDSGRTIEIPEGTVESVERAVRSTAALPPQRLEEMSRRGWTWVREHHTRERFEQEYRAFVRSL